MMKGDLGKSYRNFIQSVFPSYRGVTLERKNGGYVVLGQFCMTTNEVDRVIDERITALNSSLERIKTNQ